MANFFDPNFIFNPFVFFNFLGSYKKHADRQTLFCRGISRSGPQTDNKASEDLHDQLKKITS
jgi:hypothetical protein